MNNLVYGKTTENLRNRLDVRLVNNGGDYMRRTPTPSCIEQKIIHEQEKFTKARTTLTPNKPAHVGMCILELSKVPICLPIKCLRNLQLRIKYQYINYITIISKINNATNRDYYSQILTA